MIDKKNVSYFNGLRIMIGQWRQQVILKLRKAFFRIRHHWKNRKRIVLARGLLEKAALRPVFLDIGARGGLPIEWDHFHRRDLVRGVAVELDLKEATRLQDELPGVLCVPHALGAAVERRPLFVTASSECSSFLEPNAEVLRDYPVHEWFEVIDRPEMEVTTAATLITNRQMPQPTFVKLDVQGFERDVLLGFGKCLDEVLAIEMEGHFRPLYRHQWCVCEMNEWMRARGFILRKCVQQGPFEGEFVEGNFYFSRHSQGLEESKALLLAAWETIEGIDRPERFVSARNR